MPGFYFLCMGILPACMSMCDIHNWYPWKPEDGTWRLEFCSQHPYWVAHNCLTPVTRGPMPFSGLLGHCTHMHILSHRYTHTTRTNVNPNAFLTSFLILLQSLDFLFIYFGFALFFWDSMSSSPGWSPTHHIEKDDPSASTNYVPDHRHALSLVKWFWWKAVWSSSLN